jgi:cysteine-rich repeat protein
MKKFMSGFGLCLMCAIAVALSACGPKDEGKVELTYGLKDLGSNDLLDCQTAGVATIEFRLYPTATSNPVVRSVPCRAEAGRKGHAEVKVPGGDYLEIQVHMLRADTGPVCQATLMPASWTFSNGDSEGARVPKGGAAVLQEVTLTVNLAEVPECGNGVREPCEQCDDGNTDPGDGCSATCMVEQAGQCGNNEVEPGEECDDGNNLNGDGCSADCQIEQADMTVEWEPFDGQNTVDCTALGVGSVDVSVMPTGDPTPLAELNGVACADLSVVFTDLQFGSFDVLVEGLDASSLVVAQGQQFAVDHSSFAGTLVNVVLELLP